MDANAKTDSVEDSLEKLLDDFDCTEHDLLIELLQTF
jgi:hypothetical protein